MSAGWRVNTIIIEHQPSHRGLIYYMRFDDLRDIFRLHATIPDAFGIDNYCWTVFTLVKASRFIGSYGFFQPPAGQLFFEGQLQAAQPFRITASTRIVGWTLIRADKYMMFKFRHSNLSPESASHFCDSSSASKKGNRE